MITPEHHPQHEEEQRTAWEAQEPVITILEQQGAQALFDRIKDADDAFTEHKERLCCIDEGTAHQEGPSRWCLAGSGILYPAASWDERLARVADLCIELGITEVTNHEGCGAAKLAWHEADEPGASSDAYGRRWSEALAAAIAQKTSAGAVHHREISLDEMARPRSFHDARVVWFDATGAFEPGALGTNIPKGLLVDYGSVHRLAQNKEETQYPFTELEVAASIALGDHGFGKRFTAEQPLSIVVIARDAAELSALRAYVTDRMSSHGNRIRIDGVLRPKKSESEKAAA